MGIFIVCTSFAIRNVNRYVSAWKRALKLGKPIVVSKMLRTLMSTTDVLIAASLSPAAVVGIAIADIYHQISGRISNGLASGTGTLISQDTGASARANKNDALSQAILLAFLVGIPVAGVGFAFGKPLLSVIGADQNSARIGAVYLSIIVLSIPFENVTSVNSRALQSVGNTQVPSYIRVAANLLNVCISIVLGIGALGAPKLGVVGVAIGTLTANSIEFLLFFGALYRQADLWVMRPEKWTIFEQLLRISLPQIGMGLVTSVAIVPFNTLLLGFGTAVNAGYQLAWRFYRQLVSPFGSALTAVNSIITGQNIGESGRERTVNSVLAIVVLGGVVSVVTGGILVLSVQNIAGHFTDSARTLKYARVFSIALGISAVFGVLNNIFSSALSAASETRIPLMERIVGMFGGMVGVSYFLGKYLGWGVFGAQVGIVSTYFLMLAVSSYGFFFTGWDERAGHMMEQRGSTE